MILAVFRVRSFRFQLPADLLASWAFEMETIILGWYVMVHTGSVLLLTLFASLQFLGTLISPMFGVLGDRLGARVILCAMRAAYALLAALMMLLALTGMLTPAWVFALAACAGFVRPNDLVMRNTLIGETIPPSRLMGALGMSRATMDSARVAGALAGAGLSTVLGIGPAYVFVTGFYVASLALTFGVSRRRPVPDPAGAPLAAFSGPASAGVPRVSRWRDLREGLVHVVTTPALIAAMVGRELAARRGVSAPLPEQGDAPPLYELRGLAQRGLMQPTDLAVRAGEVLGLGGLLGSGRTELAQMLFGLAGADQGELRVNGEAHHVGCPSTAVRLGMGLCPEDRKTDGIVAELSVRENIMLALQARRGLWRFIPVEEQSRVAERFVKALGIKTTDIDMPIGQLSGGNQQKALLARWLATQPELLILDEPTRGIDVAAKQEIMDEILRLAGEGMAVLFISSEIDEVVRVSNRIAVLRDRRKVGELPGGSDEQDVYHLIAAQA